MGRSGYQSGEGALVLLADGFMDWASP